jgi:DNA polymerase-1
LQNVSKENSVAVVYAIPARRCFRCDPGEVLFLVDYAGIELRLIIDACGEEEFIEEMKRGGDVHDLATIELYGNHWKTLQDAKLKKMMRDGAKTFNFGLPYGGSFEAVTVNLVGLDAKQKIAAYDRYCKRWPKIANFSKALTEQVRTYGYIETAFGRRLAISKSKAYTGSNYIIQGTAAGVLKRAQNKIDDYCQAYFPELVQPVLPIHDELVVAYNRVLLPHRNEILGNISELMTDMPEIRVPLEVDWKMTTTNWAAAKKIKLGKV